MSETAEVMNPFAPPAAHDNGGGAMVDVAGQREVAEVQAAMVLARRFPRDQRGAMDRILLACTRPGLAEQALYTYARGGADVTGPSIRMAEAIAREWGNLQFGIRELEQRDGESTVEAFAWDLETNVRQTKVFQVGHERHSRKGIKKLTDPRDIYETVANQGARRLRACILGVIPGDVIEEAIKQCDLTLRAKADVTPERLKEMVEKFAKYKVTKDMIEQRIQRRLDAMTPALMVSLGKIYNSIKDGMSSPGDWFETGAADVAGRFTDSKDAPKPSTKKEEKKAAKTMPEGPDTSDWPEPGEVVQTLNGEGTVVEVADKGPDMGVQVLLDLGAETEQWLPLADVMRSA